MSQFLHLIFLIGVAVTTVSSGRIEKRMINGDNAGFAQFPYMISLRSTASSGHICGGSLITPEHVITAAHCVVFGNTEIPVPASDRFVISGNWQNAEGGRVSLVTAIRNHPEYNVSQTWRNDVSILKLASPVPFTATERPIALASTNTGVETCVLTGWGFTYAPSSASPSHQQTQLQDTLSNEDCALVWGASIHNSTLCAGASRGTGVCSGDSGGPLVCSGELAGVVSWGNPCGNGLPDGYARVHYFRDWINEQSADLSPLGMSYMAESLKAK